MKPRALNRFRPHQRGNLKIEIITKDLVIYKIGNDAFEV